MPILIDGHNLIGAFPGLNLADPDDERKLFDILEEYGRISRRKSVVYFDRGQAGMGPLSASGRMVQAHFVPPPRRADDAILEFLRGRNDGRHFTVVSSDSEIRNRARRAGAKVVPSADFAREVRRTLRTHHQEPPPEEPENLDEWLELFGE